jgi:hypothetical protein
MTRLRHAALLAALATTACVLTRDASTDPDERRQPQAGFQGQRFLGVAPGSYDSKARTIEATLATATQVKRYYFTEELEISADAVDLGRAAKGMCPLLDAHNSATLRRSSARFRMSASKATNWSARSHLAKPTPPEPPKAWSPAAN